MSKLSCLMAIMPDSSALTVRVKGDKISVVVTETHRYFEEAFHEPMFEVYEKVFWQTFDLAGAPWKPTSSKTFVVEMIAQQLKDAKYKKITEPIVRLAQRIAEMEKEGEQAAA